MRHSALLLLLVAAVTGCGRSAETVFDAADEAAGFLEQTAAEVLPGRSFDLEVAGPSSAWCSEADGTPARSRLAVEQHLDFELEPGDDPPALAAAIADYWQSLGHDVTADGWGTASVAGFSSSPKGFSFGFTAVDHGDPSIDVLQLSSVTSCYPRP